MILRKSAYGYRVRWLEQGRLRQQTMKTPTAAKLLHAKKVLTTRGGRRRPVEQPRISVAAFADQWLDRKQHDLAPKTYASYAETVKRYIVKAMGTLPVREVTPDDITALLTQASATSTKGHLSKDTLRIIRGTCSRLFKAAIRAHLIESNPCADLDLKLGTLTQDDRQSAIRSMTFDQLTRFHRVAKRQGSRRDAVLFFTLAETGLRPSEALALQWSDIDTTVRTLRVERAVTLGGQLKRTKTEATRTVRLTVPLAGVLAAWHRRTLRHRVSSEYVFPSRTGTLLSAKTVGRRFQALLRRAGLPKFKLYDLRHTYASQLLHLRVPLTTVARQLGHAKPTTTLQFYAHAIPDDDATYLDRLTAARQAAQ